VANVTEAWAALDETGAPLDHDPPQHGPVIRVGIDRHRDVGVLPDILDLAAVVTGGEVHLAAGHDVADRHQVRHAGRPGRGHPTHALPGHVLGERLGQLGLRTLGHRRSPSPSGIRFTIGRARARCPAFGGARGRYRSGLCQSAWPMKNGPSVWMYCEVWAVLRMAWMRWDSGWSSRPTSPITKSL